jgi:uncharacterized protein YndB with AHSA1/START domain
MSPDRDHDSTPGTLSFDGDTTVLTFVRRLPHPVDAVWAALTEPAERAAWFGATTIDGRRGGTIETLPDDPPAPDDVKRLTGRILVWDPPHVLEHEWHQAIVEASVVRYELRAEGDVTVLTLIHRGLGERNARGYIPGTHAYLDRLAAHLDGDTVPGWSTRYDEVAALYA